jgi:hypothetical protein
MLGLSTLSMTTINIMALSLTHHNDTHHSDTHHNDTQHNDTQHDQDMNWSKFPPSGTVLRTVHFLRNLLIGPIRQSVTLQKAGNDGQRQTL